MGDLRRSRTDSQGIINYSVALARALWDRIGTDEALFLYVTEEVVEELSGLPSESNRHLVVVSTPAGLWARLLRDHFQGPRWASRSGLDVLHFPKGYLPVYLASRVRTVVTIHDDMPCQYRRGVWGPSRGLKDVYFDRMIKYSLRRANAVLTGSRAAAEVLAAMARDRAVDEIGVVYHGLTYPVSVPMPIDAREPHLLHFGSELPHKRSHQAIAWCIGYLERCPDENLRLVVTGRLTPAAEAMTSHKRVLRQKGIMSPDQVVSLLRRSRALIFNSATEGFGLPPVEAYSLGTPCVWPRVSAMPEVLRGAPGGYASGSFEDFVRALDEILGLSVNSLAQIGRSFGERYSWAQAAEQYLAVYRALARS